MLIFWLASALSIIFIIVFLLVNSNTMNNKESSDSSNNQYDYNVTDIGCSDSNN